MSDYHGFKTRKIKTYKPKVNTDKYSRPLVKKICLKTRENILL